MKIIGNVGDDFIVQMTDDEMANLFGKTWHGAEGYSRPSFGVEFKIGDFYSAMQEVKKRSVDSLNVLSK